MKHKALLVAAAVVVLLGVLLLVDFNDTPASLPTPPGLQSQSVTLETPTGQIAGTLLLPSSAPPYPAVVIIAGSGRTDRDGNSADLDGKSDCLKLLAEGLAGAGIASVRYDKRGLGASQAARVTPYAVESYIDDAARWVSWLHADQRFGPVGLIGHSEGALIATLAAQRGGVRAVVHLSGAARPVDEVIVLQAQAGVASGDLRPEAVAAMRTAFAEMRAGRNVTERPPAIPRALWTGLFQPRAQEYLMSLFRYDPMAEFARLPAAGVQVLVVHGTTDLTGRPDEAAMLGHAIGVEPTLIANMNHELKAAPMDVAANDAASLDPTRPLADGLLAALIPFLQSALR